MKQLILIILILLPGIAMAQEAVITFHDGRVISGAISTVGKSAIYLPNSKHDFSEIKAIAFTERNDEQYSMTYKKLEDAGIIVSFDGYINYGDSMYPSEEEFKKKIIEAGHNEKLYIGIEKFRRSYTTGTGLILLGTAVSIIGILAGNEVGGREGTIITGAGGVISIVGTIVLAGSGKHLKGLRPPNTFKIDQ